MARARVFRQISLDKLSSPEQLDQLLQVTTPHGWLALAAIGVLLCSAAVWSVLGRIPESVTGQGILVKSGGIFQVTPDAGGRIADVAVSVGDLVTEGQVVARVAQPDLADKLRDAKTNLENARHDFAQVERFGRRDAALQRTAATKQRSSVEQGLAAEHQTMQRLEDKIRGQTQLVEQGLLTRQTVLGTQDQLEQVRQKILADSGQVAQLTGSELEIQSRADRDYDASKIHLAQAEQQLADVERSLRTGTEIVSPYTGRVLEIMVEQGSVVSRGEAVLSLDLTGRTVKDLEAIVYVSSAEGKKLKANMTIHISPSTVRKEEFGYMLGRVTYVSDFPATSKGMLRVLKNERLAAGLSSGDAPYEVHADLVVDPATASKYKWSSASGPPLTVQSGTLASTEIIVNERRPIELVLPLIRKYTGL